MRNEYEKKSAEQDLEIIDAANSDRIAYWRQVQLGVNILAQEYLSYRRKPKIIQKGGT
jgi:hypothetical protein